MKMILPIIFLFSSISSYAALPKHRFNYSAKVVLNESAQMNRINFLNCNGCDSVPLPDYLARAAQDLIGLNKVKDGIRHNWREGQLAMLIDYHHNYLHLVRLNVENPILSEIEIVKTYPVSNGKGGVSNQPRTQATPPGIHYIWKMQDGTEAGRSTPWPENWVIDAYKVDRRARRMEPAQEAVRFPSYEGSDGRWKSWQFVTTRILRMKGLEDQNDNSERYDNGSKRSILIHGTNEEGLIGVQASSGCVRMRNSDVIDLFNQVETNVLVNVGYVVDEWRTTPDRTRVGRMNIPFYNYPNDYRQISVSEAETYWQ